MKVTVCDLIANKHTQFTETDREWLSVLHEDQLAALVPVNIPTVNEEPKPVPQTWDEIIANAPAEVKVQNQFVKDMIKAHRDGLIGRIKANVNNKLSDEALAGMDDETLRQMADSFTPIANYAAGAGAQTSLTANAEEPLMIPTLNEEKK
jgi:hypothetical protein